MTWAPMFQSGKGFLYRRNSASYMIIKRLYMVIKNLKSSQRAGHGEQRDEKALLQFYLMRIFYMERKIWESKVSYGQELGITYRLLVYVLISCWQFYAVRSIRKSDTIKEPLLFLTCFSKNKINYRKNGFGLPRKYCFTYNNFHFSTHTQSLLSYSKFNNPSFKNPQPQKEGKHYHN
jgi:hypothetical protein